MTTPILPQPRTAQPSRRPIFIVHTDKLSDEAKDYLRAQVRKLLAAGCSKPEAVAYANAFAAGYRAFGRGVKREWTQDAPPVLDGWDYAHGEQAWRECMYIDACQDSAAACGYPSVNWS